MGRAAAQSLTLGGQDQRAIMTTIRAAVIGDEELLAKLNSFVQEFHLQCRPDHFKRTQLPELAGWYKALLERPTTRVWIAEEEGRPVGYVLGILQHLSENPFTQARAWLEIDQIAVDSNHRRRGIGRALVLKAIAEARAEGIQRVEAVSWSFNEDTHAVFRRLGFAPKTVRFELEARA
jgi:GNAT superfamily N-acetyltransferase